MTSNELRRAFLEFFSEKKHRIVPSAPMVLKNDPTLMFTNAGMNQFKDYFLGNRKPESRRVADTQKCLRVTGKHNDLEEVGRDTYHHTMFEMLGNWSFGDYFKEEAIAWAWEFLTGRMKMDPDRIYATIFEGDPEEGLGEDSEAYEHWSRFLDRGRILKGSKKDNFWEMGDTGPCGPCSEIHLDLRDEADREKVPGKDLVNRNHPLVIEIWNLVFIQFNRKAGGQLENLPEKHVDTGMGFERLCMALQGKKSNYDTDLFRPVIREIESRSGKKYGSSEASDVAMRVVADHLRAISFAIADGQLPSNNKAGYVIRRILRRAVRYGFTYLEQKEPFIYTLVPVLVSLMGGTFPELKAQEELISRVIREEEQSFLSTLDTGIGLLDRLTEEARKEKRQVISGKRAFELYDTFGFPLDLTELILAEKGMSVDREEFNREMEAQKNRSKKAAETEAGDWVEVPHARGEGTPGAPGEAARDRADTDGGGAPSPGEGAMGESAPGKAARDKADTDGGGAPSPGEAARDKAATGGGGEPAHEGGHEFVGYDTLTAQVRITRYRKIRTKKGEQYHLVFNITPFYAESGGQIGDRGYIENEKERIEITDTRKENELIIHQAKKLPEDPSALFTARVNEGRRVNTANNHTATHLMHHALREVLGKHVEQKGSLVDPDYLRFDFSHFSKVTDEELREVERKVNRMIRQNTPVEEHRSVPMQEARGMGAIALFGEKYGDSVRVIRFGESVELCGGIHVQATGQIGIFKIVRESSVAAGIRRIEAVTGETAEKYIDDQMDLVRRISGSFEKQKDLVKAVTGMLEENSRLAKQVERFQKMVLGVIARNLDQKMERVGDAFLVVSPVDVDEPSQLRELAFRMRSRQEKICMALGAEIDGKAHLAIMLSDEVIRDHGLDASALIREIAPAIKGGGGGQPFFATAGGKDPSGIDAALEHARRIFMEKVKP